MIVTEVEQNNWHSIASCLACKFETGEGGRALDE